MAYLTFLFRIRGSGKCLVNSVLITLLFALYCSTVFAVAANSNVGPGDSVQSISQRIKELDQQIATAKEELKQLIDQQQNAKQQLKEVLHNKPQKPENPAAMPAYNKALSEWQKQVNAKQDVINTLQRAIDVKKAEIARLEKERESFAHKLR